jgi:small subunit ribosomal protein S20
LPAVKGAQKEARASERKRLRNKAIRSQCKTNITRAERLIFTGKLKQAEEAVAVAIASLDRAAEKGVIPSNNAARRKSRLMAKFNAAQAPKT